MERNELGVGFEWLASSGGGGGGKGGKGSSGKGSNRQQRQQRRLQLRLQQHHHHRHRHHRRYHHCGEAQPTPTHRGVSASVHSGNLVCGGNSQSVHSKQGVTPGMSTLHSRADQMCNQGAIGATALRDGTGGAGNVGSS